ncbi:MAG: hypothetical protein MSA90_18480 [Faecalicatena sp.]|uniref:hypothetical protein n=1 Tax=Faecalicatena sp. TaxID=2005360 RepID=UPI0025880068|nr:hypothetical protein [Faecalicatena sp.]MCI6467436.1 hypothetical protein [Faecalicatena sp.]MDY5618134.1 hypothetical protein [Lachnospiraceae bacterium]
MSSLDIDKIIRECNYVLPFKLYSSVCNSGQVDHIKRDGEWIDIWTTDGWHWRVTVKV